MTYDNTLIEFNKLQEKLVNTAKVDRTLKLIINEMKPHIMTSQNGVSHTYTIGECRGEYGIVTKTTLVSKELV